jgi:hypothetical protein
VIGYENREHPNYVNVNLSWGSSRKLGGETFAIFNAAWYESISAIQGMLPKNINTLLKKVENKCLRKWKMR